MKTNPYTRTLLGPSMAKVQIALLDPEINVLLLNCNIPVIRIQEEDVVVQIEFPNVHCLQRFLDKLEQL